MWGGAIGYEGAPPLKIINGNLNANAYQRDILNDIEILGPNFTLPCRGWCLMHDMAPAHCAATTQRFLEGKGVNVFDWPGNSPDLNPIENVWSYTRLLPKRLPKNAGELERWVHEAWGRVPKEYIRALILSMPNRVKAVIRRKGDLTDY